MDNVIKKLQIPQLLVFKQSQLVQNLKMVNQSDYDVVFKIKTNHRTAISLQISHGFLMANSNKTITVKMVEIRDGIKLQINYSIATPQMIATNNSKLLPADKDLTRKTIISCQIIKGLQLKSETEIPSQKKIIDIFQTTSITPSLQSSISQKRQSIKFQKPQIKIFQENNQKITNFTKAESSKVVTEHPQAQEEQEIQQKLKKSTQILQQLKLELKNYEAKVKYNKWLVFGGMVVCYVIGSSLKSAIMNLISH